ncbi:hypothetical protein BBJ28_00008546 [Nothophytophthora sp. Chile5]|nr:hypothetical protein BBJ28_00008546 [Nothophytophthora sp. Chile5]
MYAAFPFQFVGALGHHEYTFIDVMYPALQPRVDPQASSYWEDDTASSREMARAMEEAEQEDKDPDADDMKKGSALVAALAGDDRSGRRRASNALPALSTQLAAFLGPGGVGLDDVDGLRVEDMGSSPLNAQLSPAGLISIAAADIDEAAVNSSQQLPPVNGELDLAFIESLRRTSITNESSETDARRPSRSVINATLAQLLGPLPTPSSTASGSSTATEEDVEGENKLFSLLRRHLQLLGSSSSAPGADSEDDAAEGQSKLRFLSLLRRINELRSQQADVCIASKSGPVSESWDGLPYPQILALPTFQYQVREHHEDGNETETAHDPQLNNTM